MTASHAPIDNGSPVVDEDERETVYTTALTDEALFALHLLRALGEAQAYSRAHGGRLPPDSLGHARDRAARARVANYFCFFVLFRHQFGVAFPGRPERWLVHYRRGISALEAAGIVADLVRGEIPGGATAHEFWVPRTIRWERVEPGIIELREG